jgi:hypothetical protein
MPTRTVASVNGAKTITIHRNEHGDTRKTDLSPDALNNDAFCILAALRLPGVQRIELLRKGEPEQTWLIGDDGSWACLADGDANVRQGGPRRLWDLLEGIHSDWSGLGRPDRQEYGLTVTAEGEHTLWCGSERGPGWTI